MPSIARIVTCLELGGAQLSAVHLANHFARKGWKSYLIHGPGGYLESRAGRFDPAVERICLADLVRPVRPVADLRALVSLTGLLRRLKPDIVHTHSSKAGVLGRLAASFAGVARVYHTIHGFSFTSPPRSARERAFAAAERFAARFSRRLIAVTGRDIGKGLSAGIGAADQYLLIRSGIDLRAIRAVSLHPADHPVIGTVSCFKPQKDLFTFLEICARLAATDASLRFEVVGDGDLRGPIEVRIRELGLTDRMSLLGWREDVIEVVARWSVFVLTSLWEGLPKAVLEAQALGVPVAATAVDGTCEVVEDGTTGRLFAPGDASAGADAVRGLMSDPSRDRIIRAASERITRDFSLEKMAEDHERLYLQS